MKCSVFFDHILQANEQCGKPIPVLLHEAKDAGICAVEINGTYLREHLEETQAYLADAGMHVSCVYDFYEMEKKDESAHLRGHIETASAVGALKILVVPGFLSKEDAAQMAALVFDADRLGTFFGQNEAVGRMAEGLRYAVQLGAEKGIAVTVEDFDDLKSPLSCSNGVLWFMTHVSGLKATFDTGNFIMFRENELQAFDLLKEYVVHVHCKDRSSEPVAAGDGTIRIAEVVNRLQTSGYGGYFAVEHFDAANQEQCMLRSARHLITCASGMMPCS